MKANWIILSIVVVFLIILVSFLIWRNWKDEKNFEEFLNENESPIEDKEDDELNDCI